MTAFLRQHRMAPREPHRSFPVASGGLHKPWLNRPHERVVYKLSKVMSMIFRKCIAPGGYLVNPAFREQIPLESNQADLLVLLLWYQKVAALYPNHRAESTCTFSLYGLCQYPLVLLLAFSQFLLTSFETYGLMH